VRATSSGIHSHICSVAYPVLDAAGTPPEDIEAAAANSLLAGTDPAAHPSSN